MKSSYNFLYLQGHETSAGIISFILFELARHPECQKKLYDEIMNIVPTGDITQENLNDLVYTDMVVREGLRMYPQVPFMERQLDEPFELGNEVKHSFSETTFQ